MPARSFQVFAHRGDISQAPENTLRSFDAALRSGADGIECDVRMTKDGLAVLCHDASLFRTTAREALVKELTYEEIRALDAGIHRGENFKHAYVPTLDEFLAKYLPKLPLELELKEPGTELPAVQLLQKYAAHDSFQRVLVHSFERALLVSVRVLDSRVNVGWLLESRSTVTLADVKHLGATAVLPHLDDLNKNFVDEAHKLSLSVRVWGVKNLEGAKQAIAAGADGATYDNPRELLAYLKEAGLRGNGAAPALSSSGSHRVNGKATT